MAGKGPAPKDPAQRRRRNKAEPPNQLAPDEELRGPELPAIFEADADWHPMTRRWWETWRRSAQAQTFADTDWDFLLDTALMHHTMWARGRWEFASELRLRVAKFGATPEDRLRLKIEVVPPGGTPAAGSGPGAKVTDIASRRRRLTG